MPYNLPMHTVVETQPFLRSARDNGMSDRERAAVVDTVAGEPTAGDLIVGSGGCRKLRVAGRGKGKSGGYRVVAFYAGDRVPVFLVAVLSKGSRQNFSDAEIAMLKKQASRLVASLGPRAVG